MVNILPQSFLAIFCPNFLKPHIENSCIQFFVCFVSSSQSAFVDSNQWSFGCQIPVNFLNCAKFIGIAFKIVWRKDIELKLKLKLMLNS